MSGADRGPGGNRCDMLRYRGEGMGLPLPYPDMEQGGAGPLSAPMIVAQPLPTLCRRATPGIAQPKRDGRDEQPHCGNIPGTLERHEGREPDCDYGDDVRNHGRSVYGLAGAGQWEKRANLACQRPVTQALELRALRAGWAGSLSRSQKCHPEHTLEMLRCAQHDKPVIY